MGLRFRRVDKDGFTGAEGGAVFFAGPAPAAEIGNHFRAVGARLIEDFFDGRVGAEFVADHAVFVIFPRKACFTVNFGFTDFRMTLGFFRKFTDGSSGANLRATGAELFTGPAIETEFGQG